MKLRFEFIPESYNKKLRRPILFSLFFIIVISLFALAAVFFLKSKIEDTKNQYFTELNIYRAGVVRERIENDFSALEAIAELISSNKNIDNDIIIKMLQIENSLNNFTTMGIADKDGNALTSSLKRTNIKHREFFQEVFSGNKYVVEPTVQSIFDGKIMTVLAVPIYKTSKMKVIDKVLFATIEKENYAKVLHLPTLSTKSYTYIVKIPKQEVEYSDEKFTDEDLNLPSIDHILDKYNSITNPIIKEEVRHLKSGVKMGNVDGTRFYLSYAPVRFNNWYIINIAPREAFSAEYSTLLYIVLGFFVVLLFVILHLFISYLILFLKMFQSEILLKKINATLGKTFILGKLKKVIVTEVGKVFDTDACIIKDYDSLSNKFTFNRLSVYFKNDDDSLKKSLMYDSNNLDKAIINNGEIVVEDFEEFVNNNNLQEDPYSKIMIQNGYKSGLRLPIMYNDTLLGMISLNFKNKYKSDLQEIALLKSVTAQISLAIKQANLYVKTVNEAKQEKILKDILSLSHSDMDMDEIFNILSKKIAETFDVTGVKIIEAVDISRLIFKSHGYIRSKKVKGITEMTMAPEVIDYWLKGTVNGNIKAISDIQTSDVTPEMKEIYAKFNIKSVAGIPLKMLNSTVYVFMANHFVNKRWSAKNLETMYWLQNYITILLKEKDLYNETKFISNVSHELRTPLTVMNSYNELLSMDETLNASQRKSVEKIQNNIDRMVQLIDDILYISKISDNMNMSNVSFEPYSLATLIESAIEQCSILAKTKNIEIVFDPIEDVSIKMEPSILQQAFINLFNNAIKYSENDKIIKVGIFADNKEIIIKIKDQGFGISENDLGNIFKRFYRVDKSRSRQTGGAGLGLPIVKQIINYHGGKIKAESVPDEGTTFTISFNREEL